MVLDLLKDNRHPPCLRHAGAAPGSITGHWLSVVKDLGWQRLHHPAQNSFTILLTLTFPSPEPWLLAFPECHTVGISRFRWLLSLSNRQLNFFPVFSWLESPFLLRLYNIPLSGCSTVYTQLLMDNLVASACYQLWIKSLWTPCVGSHMVLSFWTFR